MSSDSCVNCNDSSITAECTVDAVIAKAPNAASILHKFNIDTCCGGRATIGDAAARAHVDATRLLGVLAAVQRKPQSTQPAATLPVAPCSCGCR